MNAEENSKQRMRQLRAERQEAIRAAADRVKTQKENFAAVARRLQSGPATVPVLAQDTGTPAETVLWVVAAMKKYGALIEEGKDGSYYRYGLPPQSAGKDAAACS